MTNLSDRQHYIDWVRVLAFFLLIFFHCAMPFVNFGWEIKDHDRSAGLSRLIYWLHQWRLPLLFFISGVGIHFSLGRRSIGVFAGERTVRLFIPLVFAMLFTIPFQVYFDKLQSGKIHGGYWAWYPSVWRFVPYPDGSLSWSHMWFVVYLWVFCMLLLPLFALGKLGRLVVWKDRLAAAFGHPVLNLLPALPLMFYYFRLYIPYPIQTSLVDDWFLFLFSMTLLLYGWFLGGNILFWEGCERWRWLYLGIAAGCVCWLYPAYWWDHRLPRVVDRGLYVYGILNALHIWTLILAILGFARRHMNFSNPLLVYVNRAVYPYYILHQTVIVITGYYIVQWQIPMAVKLLLLIIICFVSIALLYHYIIRRYVVTRLLYGLNLRERVNEG